MKYAKLINGELILPKSVETINSRTMFIEEETRFETIPSTTIANPTEEQLIEIGYKEYVEKERPIEKKYHHLLSYYVETDNKIVRDWKYIKCKKPLYDDLVVSKIRQKFNTNTELSLLHKAIENPQDESYLRYRRYVEECKKLARREIEEFKNV